MNAIEERARRAALQIFEEIGLSKHSIDRVLKLLKIRYERRKP